MPQNAIPISKGIQSRLRSSPKPLTILEIAHGLGLRYPGRQALPAVLARLTREGVVVKLSGGRYALASQSSELPAAGQRRERQVQQPELKSKTHLPASDLLTGRVIAHPDGYAFVVAEKPIAGIEGDIFIPRAAVGDAMHGDRVLVRIERRSSGPGGYRAEGRIVRLLERAHATIVGLFRYGPRGNVVLPYDPRIHYEVAIPPGQELTQALRDRLGLGQHESGRARRLPRLAELDGAVVNVQLVRYPQGSVSPTGRVVEILGRPGQLGVDVEIIIRKHHLPHAFPEEVLDEAARVARPVSRADLSGREDFRHLPIVTIDGETARDFDDAVYLERRPNGWHLQVHIADVAHYVSRGGAVDLEARLRGTSVYFPDRAVPMLPEALSNDICSLNPRADRLVMSVLMEFDAAARMISSRFTPGVIRSAERMTYTNVNKVFDGDRETTAHYAVLAQRFLDMKELALLLNAQRSARGSIDFDLPEPVIEFDEEQRISAIVRSERNMAHRLIEEFMLAANRAVASYLLARGIESLHRIHEKPDARKVVEFEELARAFGYTLGLKNLLEERLPVRHGRTPAPARPGRPDSYGHGRERPMFAMLPASGELKITAADYQRLLAKLAGKPEERIVSYLMLRSLKRARYAAESLGHFALAFQEYTHFTSPIRRYPDLVVHRILRWALEHPTEGAPAKQLPRKAFGGAAEARRAGPYSRAALEEIGAESSEAERRAEAAERELMDWKTAQFMESRLGEEYDALIISVQKYGLFVELTEVFVEGLIPISALEEAAGARCSYRQQDHAIVALVPGSRRRSSTERGRPQHRATKSLYSERSKPALLSWCLGDRVRVRAERIDPLRRKVEFALADAQG